ncbi:MAG: DEAD/DEAH box helicase [Pirellulales bacterium]
MRNPGGADPSLKLRRHQEQAIECALRRESYVVTTGTGSGKSLCFFIPIVDAVVKAKKTGEGPRTRAVVIYPMNALANSQQEELKRFLDGAPGGVPVSFARYTGQDSDDYRRKAAEDPPDILLTNFMMLELLMTRQNELDRKVIENCRGLKFIVLDELHTYRGRQGADVALLMLRLRARVADPATPPIYIGTSATMASEGNEADKRERVAEVASCLFGTPVRESDVITETLRRATDPARSADKGLGDLAAAVADAAARPRYAGKRNAEVAADPLAIWVETRLGLANVESKPIRGKPQSLEQAAALLARDCGLTADICRAAMQAALLAFSLPENERGIDGGSPDPMFAFKLHQFIAGAHRLYCTLDSPGNRSVTCEGQQFDPTHPEQKKRLYAAHFCRGCGQEHHPVWKIEDGDGLRFESRDIEDFPAADEPDASPWGFLMPEPVDGDSFEFAGRDEDHPDPWLETSARGEVRLKPQHRDKRAEAHAVRADGTVGTGGRRAWFLPKRFTFCPACGDFNSDSTRDINRLASLSAEGRSSASTVLVAAILRWMAVGPQPKISRKLLSFTDNRQDAALQAGHFNDFVFVTMLRGAIVAALARAKEGLAEDQIGLEIQKSLGFTATKTERKNEWLQETGLLGAALRGVPRQSRRAGLPG